MSRIFKFFIFSLLFSTISVFGSPNTSQTSDAILHSVDHIIPELCEYCETEKEIVSLSRTVPKVSKKIAYLENFYFEFLDILSPKVKSYPTIESPLLRCGVKSFLHLLQLY